ncbi:hypothetical protein NIES4074_23360 [Cylindrospermum sp. NIES-4074]|nr:hypothetical protein NIES4074_23360 [Cylindrospermum sp. NIES-4074]
MLALELIPQSLTASSMAMTGLQLTQALVQVQSLNRMRDH